MCISEDKMYRTTKYFNMKLVINALTLYKAEMSTGYTWPSRSNLHF